MDKQSLVGLAGTFASFTLDTVHLIAATICAILTATHMGVSIYARLKAKDEHRKDTDKLS